MPVLEKIPVIEKNQAHSTLVKQSLAVHPEWENVIIETLSYQKALKELSVKSFHLIIIDCETIGVSSLEALIHVRNLKKSTPIIIINKSGQEKTAVACLKNGADYYLVKDRKWLKELPIIVESVMEEFGSRMTTRQRMIQMEKELTRLQAEEALDKTTRFYSSEHFKSIVSREVTRAGRHGLHLVCLIMDISDTAKANTHLEETALILKSLVRGSDVWARLEHNRFAALLPHTTKIQANKAIRRLNAELRETLPVPIKWGLAEFSKEKVKNVGEFIAKASQQLRPAEHYKH